MRTINQFCCIFAVVACRFTCYTQAFVLHTPHRVQSHGLRQRPGLGATAACISSVGARGHGSFAGAPVIQNVLGRGRASRRRRSERGRSMGMLFDDTILGIGGPELLLILVVGYFVLGPVELFRLTKQAGVIVGQLRDLGIGTATNLGNIVNAQIDQADKIASGAIPAWDKDPERQKGIDDDDDDDGYEEVLVDEFNRVVVNNEVRPAPVNPEDQPSFFEGLAGKAKDKANEFGLGFESEQSPIKQASKFAEQISGKVNEKVLEMNAAAEASAQAEREADVDPFASVPAGTAPGGASAAGMGMGQAWTAGTDDLTAEDYELANDVPQELTMEEQFERLDAIASLEEERALMMQRLEARIEAKIGTIKNELLEIVDEDFQDRRARVDREFIAKRRANAASVLPITTDGTSSSIGGSGSEERTMGLNGESAKAADQSEITTKETAGVGDRS